MLTITKRPLLPEERLRLLNLRPSVLFRDRRRVAQQELDDGLAEVLDIEVLRAWDLNGCGPLCCPHIYLFQICEKDYLYTESWTAFNYPDEQFPKRNIQIVCAPLTKRILSAAAQDELVSLEDSPFDAATEYFTFSRHREYEILRAEEMPEDVRSILAVR